jgi:galactosamine-6-phosphate isomerase
MEVIIAEDYKELSLKAKKIIVKEISTKKNALLCAATGDSPTKTYKLLADEYKHQPELFSKLNIIKLDEWGNISMEHPETCESYLQQHLINPLQIPDSRYISFLSNPHDPQLECTRIQNELSKKGPVDLCILGLGMNGHIALNEPNEFLKANCHVAELSDKTLQHPMAVGMHTKPTFGLTLGMADILQSKKIILLIHGAHKKVIKKGFLSGRITTSIPASFLWLHPNVVCLVDKEASGNYKA